MTKKSIVQQADALELARESLQLRIIERIARMPKELWLESEVGYTIKLLLDQTEAVE